MPLGAVAPGPQKPLVPCWLAGVLPSRPGLGLRVAATTAAPRVGGALTRASRT